MRQREKYKEKYKVDVPLGKVGDWSIIKKQVGELQAARMAMMSMTKPYGRYVPAGEYTTLMRGPTLVMSDTPDEIRDHMGAISNARGRCLINGLGIGMVLNAMLMNDAVTFVTVIEKSADVIALVKSHYEQKWGANRFEIIEADALEWKPPVGYRYECVWHDIWDEICADNLPDMHKLHRRYGRRLTKPDGWQGSWARHICEKQKRDWDIEDKQLAEWREYKLQAKKGNQC